MLEQVKNHILGYSVILAIGTATVVSSSIYFLVIQDLEREVTFTTSKNVALQQQLSTLQSTITDITQISDKRTNERLKEYKEIYITKENLLKSRLNELEISFGSCKKSLDIANSGRNKSSEAYKSFVVYLESLKTQEISVSNELSGLHKTLLRVKKDYNYRQVECDKRGRESGNICELASSQLGEISAIESEIETKRAYLNNLSEQLLKLSIHQ
ncbi:hypothetical protein EA004_18450 [Vibrio anguillarum]|uniref:Chromosome partitioning protein ParA n=2 Tax=Vibrio anguillarum TaxID=55601 RepID=A0ABR9Z9Q1_VIBAN|nr:hypothetical protein [Vibrio anguillarum]MBF4246986.1 hypothetical protein [Vibrio anguillarum]MBF4375161.1 hypothetical protein [Vibrio anguillarum]